MNADSSPDAKYSRGRQLLQFDKSHGPAFYGVWPAKRLNYCMDFFYFDLIKVFYT